MELSGSPPAAAWGLAQQRPLRLPSAQVYSSRWRGLERAPLVAPAVGGHPRQLHSAGGFSAPALTSAQPPAKGRVPKPPAPASPAGEGEQGRGGVSADALKKLVMILISTSLSFKTPTSAT